MRSGNWSGRLGLLLAGVFCLVCIELASTATPVPSIDVVASLHAKAGDLPPGVSVSDTQQTNVEAGEVQSTVVPPGKSWQCPAGRLLISSDEDKNPGKVMLRDLDFSGTNPSEAFIDPAPGFSANGFRRIRSNDHDLVALPNGDVLLVKMGQTKAPLDPKPVWFDYAYKLTYDKDDMLTDVWGPGARSEILVWRSVDCGASFQFVSSLDTALLDDAYGTTDDGSGGLPQKTDSLTTGPGTVLQPVWQMGGTDGPLVRVDGFGRVFVTIGLVGNRPVPFWPWFTPSNTKLNRTVVMRSWDSGSTWQQAAVLPYSTWRLDVVPRLNSDNMAFADRGWDSQYTGFAFVQPSLPLGFNPIANPDYPASVAPQPTTAGGWDGSPWNHPVLYKKDPDSTDTMATNIPGQTVLTRSPSSQNLLLAYMDIVGQTGCAPNCTEKLADGYRLYMYDGNVTWAQFQPIRPKLPNADDFVLHLTAVDPGRGPLLFYWYDVDTKSKTATIRGRLVTRDDKETADFAISRMFQAEDSFDVKIDNWYGDYHTAGAYVEPGPGVEPDTYHYYPVWIESDGKVSVGHVTFKIPTVSTIPDVDDPLPQPELTVSRERIDVSKLALRKTEDEEEPRRPSRVIR